ncbi:MAG: hypothetical protein SynsKO_02460 [Synoicihabitans sp.]
MAEFVSRDRYVETDSPEAADLVLYLETGDYKWKTHGELLSQQVILQRYASKTLVYNESDAAAVFLDGVYVHSERSKFVPGHQRSWLQTWLYNEEVYRVSADQIASAPAGPLCSFQGNLSHRVRQKIVRHFERNPDPRFRIELTKEWYDHTVDRKRSYVDTLLESPFTLCPRGLGAFTQRFVEVMSLGRVPVVIADDWVPPRDLNLEEVAVVVPEKDVSTIVERVMQASPRAREMGAAGRAYWLARYAPEVRLERLFDEAFDLLESMGGKAPTLADYQERWRSRDFLAGNGWLWRQRLGLRLRRLFMPDPR